MPRKDVPPAKPVIAITLRISMAPIVSEDIFVPR
jgi:hypothetical protein